MKENIQSSYTFYKVLNELIIQHTCVKVAKVLLYNLHKLTYPTFFIPIIVKKKKIRSHITTIGIVNFGL